MENEPQPVAPLVQPLPQTPTPAPIPIPPSTNWAKVMLITVLGLVIITGAVFIGIQLGKSQTNKKAVLESSSLILPTPTQTTVSPTVQPTTNPTTNPIADWKIYNSPEIGDYVSPFQLSYPLSWTINQKLTSEEPKSLTLTLTNSNNETIKILQGMGGGGTCVYYDDSDYTNFDGMGQLFSSYNQLNKPTLWRISQYRDKNESSHVVCEKTKDRYIDSTRIGWISINIKSETTIQEVKSILENIVFKPTSKTKTLFD